MSVLFFCVGAAKAGTSWLYDQLAAHPECHFRAIKELHYFDALEAGKLKRELQKHDEQQTRMLANIVASGQEATPEQLRRLGDRADWMDVLERGCADDAAYLDYVTKGGARAKVVGDMTPAYALLPAERLKELAALTPDVRFLFIMRDPIERLWSHVRMIAARRDKAGAVTAEKCTRILKRTIAGKEEQISKRSDYAATLARLTQAVPAPRLLIEVFEEMIAGEGMARICAFLGIAPLESTTAPVHVGQRLDMTSAQRQAAAHFLAPQYDAAANALGRMPEAWTVRG